MRERERNVLFNDALNTFYLRLYGVRHMVKDHSDSENETCCHHIGYSYRLTARVLLYAPCHRQDTTYHSLCYTSHGALAGTRNSSMGPPYEGSIRRPIAPWVNALPLSYVPLPEIIRDNYFNGYSFLMLYPTDRTSESTAFVTLVVEHRLECEIAPWVHQVESIQQATTHEQMLYHWAMPRSQNRWDKNKPNEVYWGGLISWPT